MSDNLKTQTVAFRDFLKDETPETKAAGANHSKILTSQQIKTVQIANETNLKLKQSIEEAKMASKNQVHKKTKLELANSYFSYIPEFYLKELKLAKILYWIFAILFLLFSIGAGVLIYFTIVEWKDSINPWILLLLIIPFVLFFVEFVVHWNKYRNFRQEAETVNFRDQKCLTINVTRLYKSLRTAYIDINWASFTIYLLLGLTILVDAIAVMFIGCSFGDFTAAIYSKNDYTYYILFWTCVGIGILIFLIHSITVLGNYLRYSNIENFYSFQIVSPEEIAAIKKHKNYRDAIIFFVVIGSFIFIAWFVFKIVSSKVGNKTKGRSIVIK